MKSLKRIELEREENWKDHKADIPKFELRRGYSIQPIPAFNGALIRFLIHYGENKFSIYYDINDSLGSVGKPYLELYYDKGDWSTIRYDPKDIDELLFDIYKECEEINTLKKDMPEMFI